MGGYYLNNPSLHHSANYCCDWELPGLLLPAFFRGLLRGLRGTGT